MKKVLTSVALASVLMTGAAVAEESGALLGFNVGYGAANPTGYTLASGNHTGFRYGLIGGYKEILSSNMGMRYYATLDFGTKYSKGDGNPDIKTINFYLNGDALFNFALDNSMEYGAFVGLALGYINHTISGGGVGESKPDGFDLGINLGLRAQSYANHSLEIYSRFGLLNQEATAAGFTYKVKQPYQVGVRYIYSF